MSKPVSASWAVPESEELFGRLRRGHGVDLAAYQPQPLHAQISHRMKSLGIASLAEYLSFTSANLVEYRQLLDSLLVGSTCFFRDAGAFQALRELLAVSPTFQRDGEEARAWVAGCSTGQEAYSVAITMLEALAARGTRRKVRVFATDVRHSALEQARRGWYREAAAAGLAPEWLERFFVRENGGYRVRAALRDSVVFGRHDLLRDPPFSNLDLLSCRNVLMYFDRDARSAVLRKFHFALQPRGTLWLGPAEAPPAALFHCQNREHRLYTRSEVPR